MTDSASGAMSTPSRRELRARREWKTQTPHPASEQTAGAALAEEPDLAVQLGFEPTPEPARPKPRRPRRRATVTSVLGELLLTAGALVLLFVVWQMWVGDIIIGSASDKEAAALSEEWDSLPPPEPPEPVTEGDQTWYEPVIGDRPVDVEAFGTITIPRFGENYTRTLAGGTTRPRTLDHGYLGLYDQSVMPGEVGNFSLAGHRTTWGAPLGPIDTLQLDDPIIVEMPEGWYVYRFRTLEYVKPHQVEVLLDVPQVPGAQTGERYITLTACSPKHSLAERIIAYGVFESFHPRAVGPPEALSGGES